MNANANFDEPKENRAPIPSSFIENYGKAKAAPPARPRSLLWCMLWIAGAGVF